MNQDNPKFVFPYRRLFACCALVSLISGCVAVDLKSLINPQLEEQTIGGRSRWTKNKILVVDISGPIASEPHSNLFFLTRCSPENVKAILNKAERDSGIKAIILRIDSPGGEVTATDMIYHELMEFKQRTGIPLVASIMGLGCSGAFYIACAADKIYAHPTSITGSIGIIARFPKLTGLASKIGYEEEILTTGDLKAMGHPLEKITPEGRQILQHSIDELFDRFLSVVMSARTEYNTREKTKAISDGRIFTAYQALDLKLIDEINYLSDVVEKTKLSLGLNQAKVVTYNTFSGQDLNIYSKSLAHNSAPTNIINVNFASLIPRDRAGFYYIWIPDKS